jgi:hypothetical protein
VGTFRFWHTAALTVVLIATLGMEATGQTFTFAAPDTARSGLLGSEIVFDVTITNTSAIALTLSIARTVNQLPPVWESSMCLNVCYPSTTDSILTTAEYGSSPLAPGESRPFSLHIFTTTNNGTGVITIVARNTREANDYRALTFHATSIPVSVDGNENAPRIMKLTQNYPNPFNPSTSFRLSVAQALWTSLRVYDLLGKEVAILVNDVVQPGTYTVPFNGSSIPSGIYVYRLESGGYTASGRMILVK